LLRPRPLPPVLWGLRGLAFVLSLPINFGIGGLVAAGIDSCAAPPGGFVQCTHTGELVGVMVGLTFTASATAYPRAFFIIGSSVLFPLALIL
jgi:hypothetical protein